MSTGYWGNGPFGGDPFDEFMAQFLSPGQPRARLDLGKVMSQDARELLQEAAGEAGTLGSTEIEHGHLLWAMTQRPPLNELLARAGADPATLAGEIEQRDRRGGSVEGPPSLTPAAKRV